MTVGCHVYAGATNGSSWSFPRPEAVRIHTRVEACDEGARCEPVWSGSFQYTALNHVANTLYICVVCVKPTKDRWALSRQGIVR